jgi:hypothetical protein
MHALLAAAAFDEVARQMIRAFEKRVSRRLISFPSHVLPCKRYCFGWGSHLARYGSGVGDLHTWVVLFRACTRQWCCMVSLDARDA